MWARILAPVGAALTAAAALTWIVPEGRGWFETLAADGGAVLERAVGHRRRLALGRRARVRRGALRHAAPGAPARATGRRTAA